MELNFDPSGQSSENDEIKKKIPSFRSLFEKHIKSYLEFVDEQQKNGNYVEIHWPLFHLGYTVMISKIRDKFLISLLDHKNFIFYGNLILEGYSCISIKDLKNFGKWSSYSKNKLNIFKPL